MMNNTSEIYILANVTYELRWSDHGNGDGYCSGGEGEEMEPQILQQEKVIRVWKPNDEYKLHALGEFSENNLKDLSYRIDMCASDHASRYCEGCYQEYRAIKAEYIKILDIKLADQNSNDIKKIRKYHDKGWLMEDYQ